MMNQTAQVKPWMSNPLLSVQSHYFVNGFCPIMGTLQLVNTMTSLEALTKTGVPQLKMMSQLFGSIGTVSLTLNAPWTFKATLEPLLSPLTYTWFESMMSEC